MTTLTAAEYREKAAECDRRRQESFERCDTDGFVTQFVDGKSRALYQTKAEIAENGGVAEFDGLFLIETGERVKAVQRHGEWGYYWMLLGDDDKPTGTFIPHSKGTKRSKMFKMGMMTKRELAPADARFAGGGYGFSGLATLYIETYRTDDGYPADAVVFNG